MHGELVQPGYRGRAGHRGLLLRQAGIDPAPRPAGLARRQFLSGQARASWWATVG